LRFPYQNGESPSASSEEEKHEDHDTDPYQSFDVVLAAPGTIAGTLSDWRMAAHVYNGDESQGQVRWITGGIKPSPSTDGLHCNCEESKNPGRVCAQETAQ
jgi:hypothetical protein